MSDGFATQQESFTNLPLFPKDNTLSDMRALHCIRRLRRFLGTSELARAERKYADDSKHHGTMFKSWRNRHRPWFLAMRQASAWLQAACKPPCPIPIQRLAADGRKIAELKRFMPDKVQDKYRTDLLLDQFLDSIFEIDTAWHYYLQGYILSWYELGQEKMPEFRVQGGGLDFDVECRRFSGDIADNFKMSHFCEVCDALLQPIADAGIWGNANLEISESFSFSPNDLPAWTRIVRESLRENRLSFSLCAGMSVTIETREGVSTTYTPEQLAALEVDQNTPPGFVVYRREKDVFTKPIWFHYNGPRKNSRQLTKRIYEVLKRKVDLQLNPGRAGVLVARFEGVTDPSVFNSEGMKDVVSSLFKRTHLAACVLQATDAIDHDEVSTLHTIPSVLHVNPDSPFQDVATAAAHLSRIADG